MKTMFRCVLTLSLLAGSAGAELVATFSQGDVKDSRMDRIPAISVEAGRPATPFLESGRFDVEWVGTIELQERRRLYFSFDGKGKASLSIDGKEVLVEEGELGAAKSERLRLNQGSHAVSIKYSSAADGSARFRLCWEEEEGLPRQSIPPTAYSVEATDVVKMGELRRHGRMAFTQNNCAKCHAPEAGFGAAPMPETGEIAPILAGIGDRVSEEWLRKWIVDPVALKPTTRMPRLMDPGTPEGLQAAADLAAFLTSTKAGAAAPEPDAGLAKQGGVHFHELGCVACHFPAGGEAQADGTGRVPLNNVASKYLPGQLVAFLKKPEAYHPFTGMPNFRLSGDEAASLAAFLRAESKGKETKLDYKFPAGDAARGAVISESLQCGTCHPGTPGGVPKTASLDTIFKADWEKKGCVAEGGEKPGQPVPNLLEGEREALIAFSKAGHASLMKDSPAEFAERQIEAKRCTACHAMDDKPALLNSLHGGTAGLAAHVKGLDERVDQTRPQLTFVGEMLYTSYIEAMLAGAAEPRPRPWLGTRMPSFGAYAKTFAEGLSRMHGFEPCGPAKVVVDKGLAEIGGKLVGAEGFGCTTCHGIGDQGPTAAFEVGAVNFKLVPERLREGYYHRWMDNPAAVIPGNKMPRYAEGNVSQRGDVLDGDARKQFEAIWQWLHAE